MKDGCCCGATKSKPCVCMKKGITKCSSKEPKCPCYKAKDLKKSFDAGWSVVKMNPRLPKDGALDGVLSRNPDPPTMHAGMPRDPDLLARLKRMHEAKMKEEEENTVDFDPETAKYGINNLE